MDHEQEIKRELVRLIHLSEFTKLFALQIRGILQDFKIDIDTCNYSIAPDGVLEYDVVIKEQIIPFACPKEIEISFKVDS